MCADLELYLQLYRVRARARVRARVRARTPSFSLSEMVKHCFPSGVYTACFSHINTHKHKYRPHTHI